MSAVNTVESLLALGVALKDAYMGASSSGATSWAKFLERPEYTSIATEVSGLLGRLRQTDVAAALHDVQAKKKSLLGARRVTELSPEKLKQYFTLLSIEGLLVRRELSQATASEAFFAWVVDSALPILISTATLAIPLLV